MHRQTRRSGRPQIRYGKWRTLLTSPLLLGLASAGFVVGEEWIEETQLRHDSVFWASPTTSLSGRRALIGDSRQPEEVYVFERRDAGWIKVVKLTGAGNSFGRSLSLDGDRALVGANSDDHEGGQNAGAAYIFESSDWTRGDKLTASDAEPGDHFGMGVSLDGDRALIGAFADDHEGLGNAGSAYVFELRNGSWKEVQKLTARDSAPEAEFGRSVSLNGNRALIGALKDDHAGGRDAGSAYIFERSDDGTWHQTAKLTAPDAQEEAQFGGRVSLDGGRALVAAHDSAYVFELSDDRWIGKKLVATDKYTEGWEVSLDGDRALIGAPVPDEESVYMFDRSDRGWVEIDRIVRPGTSLGHEVSLDGELALIASRNAVYVFSALPGGSGLLVLRGDATNDGDVNLSDAVSALDWLFRSGGAPGCIASADVNGDGVANLSDPVSLLLFLFRGGPPPVPPYPDCGPGRPADYDAPLGCESASEACP